MGYFTLLFCCILHLLLCALVRSLSRGLSYMEHLWTFVATQWSSTFSCLSCRQVLYIQVCQLTTALAVMLSRPFDPRSLSIEAKDLRCQGKLQRRKPKLTIIIKIICSMYSERLASISDSKSLCDIFCW